ncbi:MAG TPA: hypothetical protein VFG15_30250 [Amycolatopsis sp.]|nr:hypothetical protein [Amycolatopsis sp.]
MNASRRTRQRPEQSASPAAPEVVEPVAESSTSAAVPEVVEPSTSPADEQTATPETTAPENVPDDAEQPTAAPEPGADQAPAPDRSRTADGRPACRVGRDVAPELPACWRPEVADDLGICGAHFSLRPDLRREAYRGR